MKRALPVVVLVLLATAGFMVWKRGGGPSGVPPGSRAVVVERVVPHGAVAVALNADSLVPEKATTAY